ncbi:homing endonuclease associated repeat-containing protein [Halobacterium wangiae]
MTLSIRLNHGSHSHTTYVRHFGSWSNAIEAAFDTD